MYTTGYSNRPILPIADLNPNVIADNFDERTIINDDLNMNNFFIYNLKNPVDPYDAATKYYVDTKEYYLNSVNILGNLPWSRISNVPTFFPSRISTTTIDSDINLGSYKITKNGQEIIGLSNNSVITPYIANNAVTNDKIQSLDFSKLTNVPSGNASKISTLQVDSNLNMNNYIVTSNASVNAANQLVPKSYVESHVQSYVDQKVETYVDQKVESYVDQQLSGEKPCPPIVSSLVACYSLYTWTDVIIKSGLNTVNYWYLSAGNASSACYFTLSGNDSNRPTISDRLGLPGYCLNFTGGQGLFTKTLDARSAVGTTNLSSFTCFVVMKYNVNNVNATSNQACICFDGGSFGRAFYAVEDRDGSTVGNISKGPAMFVGSMSGYVKRFRDYNGTPIQLPGNTWYLVMFSYTPGINGAYIVANAFLDGHHVIVNWPCEAQDGAAYGSLGCYNSATQSTTRDYFNGQISEIVFYSRALTNNERQSVEKYLKNKWQLPFSYNGYTS